MSAKHRFSTAFRAAAGMAVIACALMNVADMLVHAQQGL